MIGTTKNKITIYTVSGSVLWESEKTTVREAIFEKYLRDADLRGADLGGADLRGADLRGAYLGSAYLRGANLRDANLRGANLRGAYLGGAYLRDANLRGANLGGAYLRGAYLGGAYLRDANLRDANLGGAYLRGVYLRDANLGGADLRGADLGGADLRGANLRDAKNIPQSYINLCSRDILFVLEHLKAEVPYLREKLVKGEVDGSQYEGECACLIGSLGKADGGIDKVCAAIPFYEKGLENYGEQWFWNIRKGDTPKNSFFAKHAVELCDIIMGKTPKKARAKAK